MDLMELMRLERHKSIIKALAELEIALNTFYNNDPYYDELAYVYKQLKECKESYFD